MKKPSTKARLATDIVVAVFLIDLSDRPCRSPCACALRLPAGRSGCRACRAGTQEGRGNDAQRGEEVHEQRDEARLLPRPCDGSPSDRGASERRCAHAYAHGGRSQLRRGGIYTSRHRAYVLSCALPHLCDCAHRAQQGRTRQAAARQEGIEHILGTSCEGTERPAGFTVPSLSDDALRPSLEQALPYGSAFWVIGHSRQKGQPESIMADSGCPGIRLKPRASTSAGRSGCQLLLKFLSRGCLLPLHYHLCLPCTSAACAHSPHRGRTVRSSRCQPRSPHRRGRDP